MYIDVPHTYYNDPLTKIKDIKLTKNNYSNLNTFHESFFNPTKINFGLNNEVDDFQYNNED